MANIFRVSDILQLILRVFRWEKCRKTWLKRALTRPTRSVRFLNVWPETY